MVLDNDNLEDTRIDIPNDLELDFLAQYLIQHKFDLICGTSIGGIISILLALEIPLSYIKALFLTKTKDIFQKEWFFKIGYSKYTDKGLIDIYTSTIRKFYPKIDNPLDLTFKFLKIPCAVSSYNVKTGSVCWFTNRTKESEDIKLIDGVLATSAGPIYFPIHSFKDKDDNKYDCLDGGIWANDPRLFAFFSQRLFNATVRHIVYNIISFGTGKYIPTKTNWFWNRGEGPVGWMLQKPNIVEILLEISGNMVNQIFKTTHLTGLVRSARMQIQLDEHISLDAVNSIPTQLETYKKRLEEDAGLRRAINDAVRFTWMMGSHPAGQPIKSENIRFNNTNESLI